MWSDVDQPVTDIYGRALAVVMKLMRVIATAGRHMAAMLVCPTFCSHHCKSSLPLKLRPYSTIQVYYYKAASLS